MPGEETLDVLFMLLPGFVTAAVVRRLTVVEEQPVFEQLVQALIYTFIVQVAWQTPVFMVGANPSLYQHAIGLFVVALAFGLFLAWAINNDSIHKRLRNWEVTKETALRNPWYEAFYQHNKHFVVLHLKDGRRVFGWPRLYPELPSRGHILLEAASWLHYANDRERQYDVRSELKILVNGDDVEFVEFVPVNPAEKKDLPND